MTRAILLAITAFIALFAQAQALVIWFDLSALLLCSALAPPISRSPSTRPRTSSTTLAWLPPQRKEPQHGHPPHPAPNGGPTHRPHLHIPTDCISGSMCFSCGGGNFCGSTWDDACGYDGPMGAGGANGTLRDRDWDLIGYCHQLRGRDGVGVVSTATGTAAAAAGASGTPRPGAAGGKVGSRGVGVVLAVV
ncbi:hypothetical protein M427DRAFT_33976 [Gonapodya prolifera JEL478]|uniref:Chitin-binding type-1 domain-containing protein n=1 Tax=Gonapodya prolifera (strain JEL478) TaxID=1344416 RepID=A0A139A9A4_GONPJ|nr:hypothetical protein M427DRAFT_33976 [Gonapodya prolifera JEL478]|eukprot:KXS13380.1 hypothetical protein M427DRAFT_33976 [Gonapodya prolifera JEL478]